MQFHQTRLANGLQIIAELTPSVHSIALGFFVQAGARDETTELSGVTHFLEHMAFKGNERFSPDDVNRVFDELGAKYNADTSEEQTRFYAAVLPEYLEPTTELLAALMRPALRQDDFDMEKKVILDEIAKDNDQPSTVAFEKGMQTYFEGHPLGRCILGTLNSVSDLTSEQMRNYHQQRYGASNMLLVVAGNCDWNRIVDVATRYCADWTAGNAQREFPPHQPKSSIHVVQRDSLQQQYVMHQAAGPHARDPQRAAADILSVIVGDAGGSRLYWELVDPGHVEMAETQFQPYHGAGVFRTLIIGPPEKTNKNLGRIKKVFEKVNRDGVTEAELQQAKSKVCSRIVLSSERPMNRLDSLGDNWVYRDNYQSVADDLNLYRSVTTTAIREYLKQYPLAQTATVAVGPLANLAWK
ncbi:MAG: processing peptidase [Planctomycetaceae bacterium]|nr:processing peptidase [Planctomycetaceae bacterium]